MFCFSGDLAFYCKPSINTEFFIEAEEEVTITGTPIEGHIHTATGTPPVVDATVDVIAPAKRILDPG